VARFVVVGLLAGALATVGAALGSAPAGAAAVQTLSLERASGPLGSRVVAHFAGFLPHEAVDVHILGNDGTPFTGTFFNQTDDNGAGSASFTLPVEFNDFFSPGAHAVRAVASGDERRQAATSFTVLDTTVSLDRTSGPLGSTVVAHYAGFGPNEIVDVHIAGNDGAPFTGRFGTQADANGSGTASFTLPLEFNSFFSAGTHAVRAASSNGRRQAATPFTVSATTVSLERVSGPLGSTVVAHFAGFFAREPVDVRILGNDGFPFTGTFASLTDDSGAGTASFTVPAQFNDFFSPGGHTVVATASNNARREAATVYTVTPTTLSLDQSAGPLGSAVTAHFSGFLAGELVDVHILGNDGSPVTGSFGTLTDDTGAGTTSFILGAPFTRDFSPGPHAVIAEARSDSHRRAATAFTVTGAANEATAVIDPALGPAGAPATIIGSGFTPGETVDVFAPGGPSTVTAGPNGEVAAPVAIPLDSSPDAFLLVRYQLNGRSSFVSRGVSYLRVRTNSALISPPLGPAGAVATIFGSGFAPGETVDVFRPDGPATVLADANGDVAAPVTIPVDTSPDAFLLVRYQLNGRTSFVVRNAGYIRERLITAVIDPPLGPAGTAATIRGSGFAPGETVDVFAPRGPSTAVADSDGDVAAPIIVPIDTSPDAYLLVPFQLNGRRSFVTRNVGYLRVRRISGLVDPPLGSAGAAATVLGSGFAPGEQVTVARPEGPIIVTAGPNGDVAAPVIIPLIGSPDDFVVVHYALTGATSSIRRDAGYLRVGGHVNAPPVLTLSNTPPNRVEATGPSGATVGFTVTATDAEDEPDPTPVCSSAPSGAVFALGGPYTVSCSVTDSNGATSSGQFSFSVVDTTAPALVGVPANITTQATSPNGAVVNYASPTATDAVDTTPSVACSPASGSVFPIGTTTVTCFASDDATNTSSAGFTVTVTSPPPPSYRFDGFFQPVANGSPNQAKGGSTVPLKFRVFDGAGREVTDAGIVRATLRPCSGGAETALANAGGSTLRYDTDGRQFVLNWKTPKEPGACYVVIVRLPDNIAHTAEFRLS
jgi:hypothetical protein